MSRRPARLVAGLALALVVTLTGVRVADVQTGGPTVRLESQVVRIGGELLVRGTNFVPSSLVLVELCGNNAARGSADCDQTTAVNAGVTANGSFNAGLLVGTPPTPCPCVVRLSGIGAPTAPITEPITVVGVPVLSPEEAAARYPSVQRQVRVSDAKLEGSGPWTAWFGGSAERTLVFTIENVGNVAVTDPPLVLASGKGSEPTGVVETPDLGTLQPGERRTYRVPVDLGAMAFGNYRVVGQITGFAEPVAFQASSSAYPWALIILPILALLEILLLRSRNRLRRRLDKSARLPGPPELPAPTRALVAGATATAVDSVQAERAGAPVGATVTAAAAAAAAVESDDEPAEGEPDLVAPLVAEEGAVAVDEPVVAPLVAEEPVVAPEELEETIVAVLTETLRSLNDELGSRKLDDADAARLATTVASEVSATVTERLQLPADHAATLEELLHEELARSLSADHSQVTASA